MKIDTSLDTPINICVVIADRAEVVARLDGLGMDPQTLLQIAARACLERANATPFHAANAAGTFAYQYGTFALREMYVGRNGWVKERPNGVEAIWNPTTGARVVFANVDTCCNREYEPKPKSTKGAGAERTCETNLFGSLPRFYREDSNTSQTFYLMVDDDGRVELSRPVIRGKTFSEFPERIFLKKSDDDETFAHLPLDDDDTVVDFDPLVAPKASV